jgi:ribosomal protein S6
VKRYEGLFIFNHTAKDETIKETVDEISAEITGTGGKVETVQKMDKRNFARVANKKHPSGFYVNFIFEAPPAGVAQLRHRLAMNEEIFRVLCTVAPAPKEATTPTK